MPDEKCKNCAHFSVERKRKRAINQKTSPTDNLCKKRYLHIPSDGWCIDFKDKDHE